MTQFFSEMCVGRQFRTYVRTASTYNGITLRMYVQGSPQSDSLLEKPGFPVCTYTLKRDNYEVTSLESAG